MGVHRGGVPTFGMFVGWAILTIVAGALDIQLTPAEMPKAGERMSLVCRPAQGSRLTRHCFMAWSRVTFTDRPGTDSKIRREWALNSSGQDKVIHYIDRESRPVSVRLTIAAMSAELDGQYTCTLKCPDFTETGTLLVQVRKGLFPGFSDDSQLFGALTTVVIVVIILVVSICLAFCECRGRRLGQPGRLSDLPFTDGGSQEGLLGPTADPPPRYSVVVVTNGEEGNHTQRSTANVIQPVLDRVSTASSVDGVFVIPTPPPDYRQALLDMADKGVILKPENLRPAPPAYTEVDRQQNQEAQARGN